MTGTLKVGPALGLVVGLILVGLIASKEHGWPQKGYNWLQQNAAPFQGPQQLRNNLRTLASQITFYPLANGNGTVFAGVGEMITAYDSSSLAILWQVVPHVRYTSYTYYNAAVSTDGNLIVAVGPSTSNYIQTFLTLDPQGQLLAQTDITFQGSSFFLGPQNEIILIGSRSWTVVSTNATLPGTPLAGDDVGGVYVDNTTSIYKISLQNLGKAQWNYPLANKNGVGDLTVYKDTVLLLTTGADNSFLVVSLDLDTGSSLWTFNVGGFSFPGQLAVTENYIFLSYSKASSGPWSQLTLSNDGFLLNTISSSFGDSFLLADSHDVVLAYGIFDSSYNVPLLTRAANGSIISTTNVYDYCPFANGHTGSLFYTNSTALWLTTLCSFMFVQ